jgi:hypothetical protein
MTAWARWPGVDQNQTAHPVSRDREPALPNQRCPVTGCTPRARAHSFTFTKTYDCSLNRQRLLAP